MEKKINWKSILSQYTIKFIAIPAITIIVCVYIMMALYIKPYIIGDNSDIIEAEISNTIYVRDSYVERLESKFSAARENLALEVDKYIHSVAPTSSVTALNLIDLCAEYNIDLRLVLVQGHVESHFGTKGTASRTNSIFNVGAYDGYSVEKQMKNGFGYKHPDYSVEPYLKLITSRYLVDGKREEDLLNEFVDKNGKRYASCETYESLLRSRWDKIDSIANITEAYNIYKMYKLQLGR